MTAVSRSEIQTSLRMPKALYEHLSAAAETNGHGVGEEMRRRLLVSFAGEPPAVADPNTCELLSAVARMAAVLAQWFGPWNENAFASRVFRHAVGKLLVLRGAREDEPVPAPQPRSGSVAAALFKGKPTVGGVTAALVALALADYPAERGGR